jgi:hypothetical protein
MVEMVSSKLYYSVNICFRLLAIAMQGLGTKEARGRKQQREWILLIRNASFVSSSLAEKGNSSSKSKTTEDC